MWFKTDVPVSILTNMTKALGAIVDFSTANVGEVMNLANYVQLSVQDKCKDKYH